MASVGDLQGMARVPKPLCGLEGVAENATLESSQTSTTLR